MNEAERYPEARKGIYKIENIHDWVTRELITEIEEDIKFFENKFSQAKRDVKIKY